MTHFFFKKDVEIELFCKKNNDGAYEMVNLINQSYIHRNQLNYARRTPD